MTTIQDHRAEDSRPLWLPHPALLAFIAVLWAIAGAAQGLGWLSP